MIKGIDISNVPMDIARDHLNDFPLYNHISGLGSFGKIVFAVSANNILTPTEISVTVAARKKKHQRLKTVDITEFLTRELKKIVIPIKLVRGLCNIESTIKELQRICEVGENYPLILARKKIGEHNFLIDNLTYKYGKTDSIGRPLVAELNLTLEEYIERIERVEEEEIKKTEGTVTEEKNIVEKTNSKVIKLLNEGRLW